MPIDVPASAPPANTEIYKDIVCWTRMQAESGQDLLNIVRRKEIERRANGGIFFWGVGNAPTEQQARLPDAKLQYLSYSQS